MHAVTATKEMNEEFSELCAGYLNIVPDVRGEGRVYGKLPGMQRVRDKAQGIMAGVECEHEGGPAAAAERRASRGCEHAASNGFREYGIVG